MFTKRLSKGLGSLICAFLIVGSGAGVAHACADNGESISLQPSLVKKVGDDLSKLKDKNLLPDDLRNAVSNKDYTVLDGAVEGPVTNAKVIISKKNFLISTTKDNPNIVSLSEISIDSDGKADKHDALLPKNKLSTDDNSVSPRGYYGKSCVKWNGTCLKNFVKNGCHSGICAFVGWNPSLAAGCLLLHCGLGVNKCCSKWGDGYWHEW